jgi:hypothetical protein
MQRRSSPWRSRRSLDDAAQPEISFFVGFNAVQLVIKTREFLIELFDG